MITKDLFWRKRLRGPLLMLTIGLFAPLARAQQLDDVVVSACHETQSPGGGTLCWTLGELMVEFYANGEALDQGFLQGYCTVTDVTDPTGESGLMPTISIYPNPAAAWLNIQATAPGAYSAELLDVHGRRLLMHPFSGEKTALDLSACPAGTYLLRVVFEEKNASTFIIQKIK